MLLESKMYILLIFRRDGPTFFRVIDEQGWRIWRSWMYIVLNFRCDGPILFRVIDDQG